MAVLPRGRAARRFYLLLLALFLCGAAASAAAHLHAWYHYRKAQTALEQYHFTDARGHLTIPARAWPNSWRVHLLAARAARLADDSSEAERLLHRCQQLQPTNREILLEWALLRAGSGDLATVEDYLRAQPRHDAEQARWIQEALIEGYTRTYRISEAFAGVEDWLKRQPDDTQALFLQGCIWQQIQRPQSALTSYRRAIELDPRRDDIRWRLAQCLLKLGLSAEAADHLEYLHRHYPEKEEMAVELACSRFKQGRLADAQQLLDAVLAEHSDCVSALVERGRIALTKEDVAGAEKRLQQAVRLNPHDSQALHLLSLVLRRQGERDKAEAIEDQLKRSDRDLKRLSAICLRELGERPHDPLLHEELGALLLRLGYQEAGRNWLLLAQQEDPNSASVRALLESARPGAESRPTKLQ